MFWPNLTSDTDFWISEVLLGNKQSPASHSTSPESGSFFPCGVFVSRRETRLLCLMKTAGEVGRPQCPSTHRIMLADVPLAKVSHVAKPNVSGREDYL